MAESPQLSRRQAWLIAARPQTLPAAISPILVGTGLAVHDNVFAPLPAIVALLSAVLIQIGTNFANDYFDAKAGADEDAEGFTRVTQAELLPAHHVWRATLLTFGLAMVFGVYLVIIGGLPIIVIGLASVLSGLLYTGGPYPFGYYGLGDLFVFVFFGIIAVTGTYYVQAVTAVAGIPLGLPAGTITGDALIASLPMAGLITDILVINNIRDIESDRQAGKYTLAVRLGYRLSRFQFLVLIGLAYVVPIWFFVEGYSPAVLLPVLTLPIAMRITTTVFTHRYGQPLNDSLEQMGQLTASFALLFGLGLAL